MHWEKPKNKSELAVLGLRATAIALLIIIIIEILGGLLGGSYVPRTIKAALTAGTEDPNDLTAHLTRQKEAAELLKQKNMFVPTPKPSPPTVSGILGDAALVNGKWCRAGETAGDVKIITIGAVDVKIEWQGKEITIAPVKTPSTAPPGPRPDRPPPTMPQPPSMPGPQMTPPGMPPPPSTPAPPQMPPPGMGPRMRMRRGRPRSR